MVSKAVRKCERILTYLAEQGFTLQVTKKELHKAIAVLIGADPRTLRNWENTLKLLEYIEPVSPGIYRLNFVKVPSALVKAVSGSEGQKKLM
jgi:hypothetical protein